ASPADRSSDTNKRNPLPSTSMNDKNRSRMTPRRPRPGQGGTEPLHVIVKPFIHGILEQGSDGLASHLRIVPCRCFIVICSRNRRQPLSRWVTGWRRDEKRVAGNERRGFRRRRPVRPPRVRLFR